MASWLPPCSLLDCLLGGPRCHEDTQGARGEPLAGRIGVLPSMVSTYLKTILEAESPAPDKLSDECSSG